MASISISLTHLNTLKVNNHAFAEKVETATANNEIYDLFAQTIDYKLTETIYKF